MIIPRPVDGKTGSAEKHSAGHSPCSGQHRSPQRKTDGPTQDSAGQSHSQRDPHFGDHGPAKPIRGERPVGGIRVICRKVGPECPVAVIQLRDCLRHLFFKGRQPLRLLKQRHYIFMIVPNGGDRFSGHQRRDKHRFGIKDGEGFGIGGQVGGQGHCLLRILFVGDFLVKDIPQCFGPGPPLLQGDGAAVFFINPVAGQIDQTVFPFLGIFFQCTGGPILGMQTFEAVAVYTVQSAGLVTNVSGSIKEKVNMFICKFLYGVRCQSQSPTDENDELHK